MRCINAVGLETRVVLKLPITVALGFSVQGGNSYHSGDSIDRHSSHKGYHSERCRQDSVGSLAARCATTIATDSTEASTAACPILSP
eukprot:696348-Amphidinium_carterae.1